SRDRMEGVPDEAHPMKSHTEYLTFNLPARMAFVNSTPQVDEAVQKSGVREGLVLVNAMHITASVFINDDEPGLHEDYKRWLEGLAPFDASPSRYQHNRTGEDNADAHLKRQDMRREVVVAITKGKLHFRPWEPIFYSEFDGGGLAGTDRRSRGEERGTRGRAGRAVNPGAGLPGAGSYRRGRSLDGRDRRRAGRPGRGAPPPAGRPRPRASRRLAGEVARLAR